MKPSIRGGVSARPGRKLSRRQFIQIASAGVAGVALLEVTGCGGGGGGQGGGGNAFTFAMGQDTTGGLTKLVDRFNEQYQGEYTANYREMPTDSNQYFDQLRTEFQAGGSEINIFGGDVVWPAQFAAPGYILDLSDRFPEEERSKFLPGPVESNTFEGAIYGVPWYTDAGLLYYRQDLLEQSGFSEPPKTWEELKEQALKTAQDSGTRNGFIYQGANYEGVVVNATEFIYSHGGAILDANDSSKVVVDSPETVAGLTTMRSMVEDGVAPEAVSTFTETECEPAFLRGDTVFLRAWPQTYSTARNSEDSAIEQAQIGVAPLPAGEGGQSVSGLGGWNFMINSSTENPDAAYEFVKFATSPEIQKFYAIEGARLPVLQESYQDRELLDQVPVVALAEQALKNAQPRPVSPYYSDMSLAMAEQFNNVVKGAAEPQQAVSTLQEELSRIVEQGQQ